MRDLIAEARAADAEYLRTVLPVVLNYVKHLTDGADLDRLRRVATLEVADNEVALIDALIAARGAAKRVLAPAPIPVPTVACPSPTTTRCPSESP